MTRQRCDYCGGVDRVRDTDREPRPMWVCADCGMTWIEAHDMANEYPEAAAQAHATRESAR